MADYITKERARDLIVTAAQGNSSRLACMLSKLEDEPPADVVEVVRCKDCKNLYPDDTGKLHWCDCHRMFVGLDDFCNYGKRKDGGESDDASFAKRKRG